jgi:hypothetical protein
MQKSISCAFFFVPKQFTCFLTFKKLATPFFGTSKKHRFLRNFREKGQNLEKIGKKEGSHPEHRQKPWVLGTFWGEILY